MRIALTADEQELLDSIEFEPSTARDLDAARQNGARAAALMQRLARRGAIPQVRLRHFTDTALNVGATRSRQQLLVDAGTPEPEMASRPEFLQHLRYCICGPRLHASVIAEFRMIASAPSPELEQFRRLVRARARTLEVEEAGEEFFKLALESGLELEDAKTLRSDARNAAAVARRRR